jgi:hypothetical protein
MLLHHKKDFKDSINNKQTLHQTKILAMNDDVTAIIVPPDFTLIMSMGMDEKYRTIKDTSCELAIRGSEQIQSIQQFLQFAQTAVSVLSVMTNMTWCILLVYTLIVIISNNKKQPPTK